MAGIAGAPGGGLDWSQGSTTEQPMKRATYQDVLNAPENKVAEILDGDLFLSPRPASRHTVASSRIGRVLGPFDDDPAGPGGWWILDGPELHFGEDVLVPDLAGWRRDRMPAIADVAFFTLSPDWVCEVLSPSTARIDRRRKLPIYARAGIPFAWLVDPVDRLVEVLQLRDGVWSIAGVRGDTEVARLDPFGAIEVALARLWGDPVAPASPPEGTDK
jgi:Uma2 family endonuclease